MHENAYVWLKNTKQKVERIGTALEIGSCNYNGTVRDFYQAGAVFYVGVDIIPGPNVDVVGDINKSEFRDFLLGRYGRFETIMSTETLEHTPAEPLIRSMLLLLDLDAPACRLILTCANKNRTEHGFNGGGLSPGEHYENVSEQEVIDYVRKHVNQLGIDLTHRVIFDVPISEDKQDTYAYIEFVRVQ